ncbi:MULTISPECIES: hypothetical protein [unclassified Bradyrhizobium]|uniref:hypothetical protein n=1 Tax=unclassified Bradyrhizobium TaxID=2631580 RepID=UPI002916F8AC|nr:MULTISPECIES: hypothetical protein [unclassified Bradyrhizobium]
MVMTTHDNAALAADVARLEEGHAAVRGEVRELKSDMRSLEGKVDSGFAMLGQKLDAKTTPQWQPITIAVTVLLFIGGVFISSIKEALNKNENALAELRRENEARIIKLWDAENATARAVATMQGQFNPLPGKP